MSNLDYTDKLAEILAKAKKNHISYGKDPSALTAAILSAACLKEGEKMIQAQLAFAGNTSAEA